MHALNPYYHALRRGHRRGIDPEKLLKALQ
jgi:hypothetical protein